jgi:predicted nucleotidyltransferase
MLNELKQQLQNHIELLNQRFKVKRLGIFGLYSRNEATPQSDVDILVEFSEPIGWEIVDLRDYLTELLGHKVDLVTMKALKPQLKDEILRQVVYL